ncbi:Rho termination factor [Sphingobacterium cellulitidis]|nr:Rho termination factor [Sphingobacterium cellulitidis]
MPKDKTPQLKKPDTYDALVDKGMSKEKAARISNAQAAGTIDHNSKKLEERSKSDLLSEAKEIGIKGRHNMNKEQLIKAIRKG